MAICAPNIVWILESSNSPREVSAQGGSQRTCSSEPQQPRHAILTGPLPATPPPATLFALHPLKPWMLTQKASCEGGAWRVSSGGSASFPTPPAPALSWDLPALGARR